MSSPIKLKLDPCFAGQCPPVSDSPISWVRDPCITWPEWRSQNRRAGTHYITHYRHRQGTVGGSNEERGLLCSGSNSKMSSSSSKRPLTVNWRALAWTCLNITCGDHTEIIKTYIPPSLELSRPGRPVFCVQKFDACTRDFGQAVRYWPGHPVMVKSDTSWHWHAGHGPGLLSAHPTRHSRHANDGAGWHVTRDHGAHFWSWSKIKINKVWIIVREDDDKSMIFSSENIEHEENCCDKISLIGGCSPSSRQQQWGWIQNNWACKIAGGSATSSLLGSQLLHLGI